MIRLVERMIYPMALLVAVLGIVYWYWTTTPGFALNAVIGSIREHDTQAFEKYVDIDAICSHAFDDILEGPARSELHGRMDSMIGVGFIKFFKRDIIGMARDKIISYVRDPELSVDKAHGTGVAKLKNFQIGSKVSQYLTDYGLTKQGFKGLKYLKVNGSNANFGLLFHSPRLNEDWVADFKMEDSGGYWRITQLANLNELTSKYLETRRQEKMLEASR